MNTTQILHAIETIKNVKGFDKIESFEIWTEKKGYFKVPTVKRLLAELPTDFSCFSVIGRDLAGYPTEFGIWFDHHFQTIYPTNRAWGEFHGSQYSIAK